MTLHVLQQVMHRHNACLATGGTSDSCDPIYVFRLAYLSTKYRS